MRTYLCAFMILLALVASFAVGQPRPAAKAGSAEALARQRAYEDALKAKPDKKAATTVTDVLVHLSNEVKSLKAEVAELRKELTALKAKVAK